MPIISEEMNFSFWQNKSILLTVAFSILAILVSQYLFDKVDLFEILLFVFIQVSALVSISLPVIKNSQSAGFSYRPGAGVLITFLSGAFILYTTSISSSVVIFDTVLFASTLVLAKPLLNVCPVSGNLYKIVIVGTGPLAEQIRKELQVDLPNSEVVGFVSIASTIKKKQADLLGTIHEIKHIVESNKISEVFIASSNLSSRKLRDIAFSCRNSGVRIRHLGFFTTQFQQPGISKHARDLQPEDILLGRETIALNNLKIAETVSNKVIMVTGAGGSIGSEICRQIAYYRPRRLILFELTELFLFNISNELKTKFPGIDCIPVIGNIQNSESIDLVYKKYAPDVVFHAAAYKHVPMMQENAYEAVMNNVQGTWNLASLAKANHIKRFVLLSTDKAVNPVNTMGATKRVCELICQRLQDDKGTRFMAVRFGNVLGSTGSVIPTFKRQIENGGPVTLTHEKMTRYFMSIAEASQLVIQAGSVGNGGEVFVLDMGQPVLIYDLARDMIDLMNKQPGREIEIKITGLRPGEKLAEQLLTENEAVDATAFPGVYIARLDKPESDFYERLKVLLDARPSDSNERIQGLLKSLVVEYSPAKSNISSGVLSRVG